MTSFLPSAAATSTSTRRKAPDPFSITEAQQNPR
jgi:hypothetical protein